MIKRRIGCIFTFAIATLTWILYHISTSEKKMILPDNIHIPPAKTNPPTESRPPTTTTTVETTTEPQKKVAIVIMYPQYGGEPFTLTPSCGGCEVSIDGNKVHDETTKALIFHFNDPIYRIAPKTRLANQYYVWSSGEGPVAIYHFRGMKMKEYDGFFNLTMSYKMDSDVWCPYGSNYWLLQQRPDIPLNDSAFDDFLKRKTRTALWVVSNCGLMKGSRERLKYAKDLAANGLNVDFGGSCFGNTKRNYKDYENYKYKFYLSFENQWPCKDYITEKFWRNGLQYGAVPVVLGPLKKDYELVAPSPNSFIYAPDFASPKKLADYLNYLDKNDTAYREYLSWMKSIPKVAEREKVTSFCSLCMFLQKNNNENPERRTVRSLHDWYYGQDYQKCLDVPNLGIEI